MVLIEEPWSRNNRPVAIPEPLTIEVLGGLDDVALAELIRDHLGPRQPTPAASEEWGRLWALLADKAVVDDAFGVLDEFLDQVEEAMASPGIDAAQLKRMRKFQRLCAQAENRLDVIVAQPLGWAGREARKFPPVARSVIAALIDAIAEHRKTRTTVGAGDDVDESLWQVLGEVGLDPEEPRRW